MVISDESLTALLKEVVSINLLYNNNALVRSFLYGLYISNFGDEDNVLLERCMEGEKAFMLRPQVAKKDLFYFY